MVFFHQVLRRTCHLAIAWSIALWCMFYGASITRNGARSSTSPSKLLLNAAINQINGQRRSFVCVHAKDSQRTLWTYATYDVLFHNWNLICKFSKQQTYFALKLANLHNFWRLRCCYWTTFDVLNYICCCLSMQIRKYDNFQTYSAPISGFRCLSELWSPHGRRSLWEVLSRIRWRRPQANLWSVALGILHVCFVLRDL